MPGFFRAHMASAALLAVSTLFMEAPAQAQPGPQQPPIQSLSANPNAGKNINEATPSSDALLDVPQVHITPGAVSAGPKLKNPMAGDPNSAQRGMEYFKNFNCVGCHAPNGGGGMGISLSNSSFKFGSDPANIYLVISHGAPLGMPAWGSVLPDNVIWDLVSYVESISKEPTNWGTTVSTAIHMPAVEQVPAEFKETAKPWDYVQPFSKGQKPTNQNPTSTKGQDPANNKPLQ